jgi:predicted nucleic acid-binding protein
VRLEGNDVKVLVDTSIWIEHLKKTVPRLEELLDADEVMIHAAVLGELACGNIKNRKDLLNDLQLLERVEEASTEDVLLLIESRKLFGKGLSWVDCQLLASAAITGCEIFTRDKLLEQFS